MRTSFGLLAIASALLCVGCAGTTNGVRYQKQAADPGYIIKTNDQYVARVEHLAARRGVDVEWVNPPQIRVAKKPVRSNDGG